MFYKIRTTILLVAFILLVSQIYAQMLTPTVIASTGAFSSNSNGSLSYTVGEMTMVQTFSANNYILTQGFLQPGNRLTGLLDIAKKDEVGSFVVYPNPAVENIWYGFQFPEKGKLSISLYNGLGQKVSDVYRANYENGKIIEQMDVSFCATGMYFLKLNFINERNGKEQEISCKFQLIR